MGILDSGLRASVFGPIEGSVGNGIWLMQPDVLSSVLGADPALANGPLDSPKILVLVVAGRRARSPAPTAAGVGFHVTSVAPCSGACHPLQDVLTDPSGDRHRIALYDDEAWRRTPTSEQRSPCTAMNAFVEAADGAALQPIVAPDQNLAQPGNITEFQGQESENWQAYLRLGIARCAALSHPAAYHIMSQPFETHWCGNQIGGCQGGEASFVDFVTQATLQARAVNPGLTITDGIGANDNYNSSGEILYQDAVDTENVVDGTWVNRSGGSDTTAQLVDFFRLLGSGHASPRSSVYFPSVSGSPPGALTAGGLAGAPSRLDLSEAGRTWTFVDGSPLPASTALPAGPYEIQFWTDGASGTAKVGVEIGYCSSVACHDATPIAGANGSWHVDLSAGQQGGVSPSGAFTTSSEVVTPPGPHYLYLRFGVEQPGPFDLLVGPGTPTNVATPILQELTHNP